MACAKMGMTSSSLSIFMNNKARFSQIRLFIVSWIWTFSRSEWWPRSHRYLLTWVQFLRRIFLLVWRRQMAARIRLYFPDIKSAIHDPYNKRKYRPEKNLQWVHICNCKNNRHTHICRRIISKQTSTVCLSLQSSIVDVTHIHFRTNKRLLGTINKRKIESQIWSKKNAGQINKEGTPTMNM